MPVEKQEVFLERVAVHREQAMLTPLSGQSHRSENHLAFWQIVWSASLAKKSAKRKRLPTLGIEWWIYKGQKSSACGILSHHTKLPSGYWLARPAFRHPELKDLELRLPIYLHWLLAF